LDKKSEIKNGRIFCTLRFVVPKGAPFARTVRELKAIGFIEEDIRPHIQSITPEKLTDREGNV